MIRQPKSFSIHLYLTKYTWCSNKRRAHPISSQITSRIHKWWVNWFDSPLIGHTRPLQHVMVSTLLYCPLGLYLLWSIFKFKFISRAANIKWYSRVSTGICQLSSYFTQVSLGILWEPLRWKWGRTLLHGHGTISSSWLEAKRTHLLMISNFGAMPNVDVASLDFVQGFSSKSLVQSTVTRYDVVLQHYPSKIAFASIWCAF